MSTAQHPDAQRLAAYKSGKLPGPDASTIEAHLSSCETCLEAFAVIPATDPLEKRLRGGRQSVPTVDQPVQDWIDDLRGRNPLAKSSRDDTDDFLKRLAPAQSPDKLGRLGRYRILKRLGRGGMGSVYLAHDTQLNRQVALKIPRFSPDDEPRYLERFLREARAAAALDHPNICSVYEADQINGVNYISMAYIDGKPLSEYIGDKPIPPRQAAAVIRELALALDEAHARGIIHRDLKPSNIMVNKRRKLVIMDFGLAGHFRLTDAGDKSEKSRLTSSGMIIGTPAYMSPEQATGDIAAMGPPCDIYSLGVIMYELLAGELPFDGPLVAVLGQIMVAEPTRPSSRRAGVIPELEAICLKAMAKKISDRFGSMGDLAAALCDFLRSYRQQDKVATTVSSPPEGERAAANATNDDALGHFFAQIEAEKKTAPKPSRMPIRAYGQHRKHVQWGLVAAALGAFLLLLWGGHTIWVRTGEGTIKIQLSEEAGDVKVIIDGSKELRIENLGDPITLMSGKHEIVVKQGDIVIGGEKFTLYRGKNPALQVQLESAIAKNDTTGNSSLSGGDSAAAKWVLEVGGTVTLKSGSVLKTVDDLPSGRFAILKIDLTGKPIDDKDLANLEGLADLEQLVLWQCSKVTGTGLVHLSGSKKLTALHVAQTALSDAGLQCIVTFSNLSDLQLGINSLTDLEKLRRISRLRKLDIGSLRLKNGDLIPIKELTGMEDLRLGSNELTDEGLVHLRGLTELRILSLRYMNITDDGLAHLSVLKDLEILNLTATKVTDGGLKHLE
jgi:serine/threonine protein kinase